MQSVAQKMLLADRGKLLTALIGVVFAVVLVNMQAGLFMGFVRRAGMLVDNGEADIWVGHRSMRNVDFPENIPRRWIQRIRGIPGVKEARPYLIGSVRMTLPSGAYEEVFVVGVDRKTFLGHGWNFSNGGPEAILKTDGIIFDECEAEKLEFPALGEVRELGGRRARIVGTTRGVMGFLVMPYLFTTYERAARYLGRSPEVCSYYLLQVEEGTDVASVCRQIRERIPYLDAYSRDEYTQVSVDFWLTRVGFGISFGASTFLGVLVGLVMVAETLYAMVLDRLGEFGTLKAIGASESQVYGVLFTQAVVMAVMGSLIGLAITWGMQHIFNTPKAPIIIPWQVTIGSFVLVLCICLVSSWIPYLRIRNVDPMMVLQT